MQKIQRQKKTAHRVHRKKEEEEEDEKFSVSMSVLHSSLSLAA